MSERAPPPLAFVGIGKRFGERRALDGVDLELRAGELHALLGENGAGKTTLVRLALGLLEPDEGEIRSDGVATKIASPAVARALGIGMVHQHFALAEGLTVAENLALAEAPRAWRKRSFEAAARQQLLRHGLDLDPAARVGDLPIGLRQRLEIAKALAQARRVLLLDEPTALLTPSEAEALFAELEQLRARGLAILLITHRLEDALRLADRITVLREGRVALAAERGTASAASLARALFGGAPDVSAPPLPPRAAGALRIAARRLVGERFGPLDLEVRGGEAVVLTGVEAERQAELLEVVAGLAPPRSGDLEVAPGARAFISGDRQRHGLALPLSIAENVALAPATFARPWFTSRELLAAAAPRLARFDVRATSPWQAAAELSGGNQQRVVLARELAGDPPLLLAENPTRGLDLQATAFVHAQLRAAVANGAALLLATSDLDEALALATRLFVLFRGALHPCAPRREAVAEKFAALAAGAARGARGGP
ncbi:MAG: ATP-binding cassette domain-containing protein [Planctomycetes bacterium]|nr:ATP-binding cassette domain-containing protein [Planctomycetota bacterium]